MSCVGARNDEHDHVAGDPREPQLELLDPHGLLNLVVVRHGARPLALVLRGMMRRGALGLHGRVRVVTYAKQTSL